jgi:EAL domain-containing protein (putative c-di-GMP-specific phosphodiesterase class I)
LIRNADIAMYSAKRVDRQRFALYEPGLHGRLRHQRQLALDLEQAVERGEIVVHYQPIVSLVDGSIRAFEALARWEHPERGLIMPSEFLGAAEDSGLIVELGLSVIDQAFRCVRTWPETGRGAPPIGIWINLAPGELTNERLVEDLALALTRAGVDSDRLTVEITESSVIRDEEGALKAMRGLRDLGVHLSIDDFGTGYSSLSRLAEFPIETLKIPKPFVGRLIGDDPDNTFVDAILRLAGSLGLETVGEGIEHVAQVRRLRQLGCGLGQGYLFSRPMTADEVSELLTHPRSDRHFVAAGHLLAIEAVDATLSRGSALRVGSAGSAA